MAKFPQAKFHNFMGWITSWVFFKNSFSLTRTHALKKPNLQFQAKGKWTVWPGLGEIQGPSACMPTSWLRYKRHVWATSMMACLPKTKRDLEKWCAMSNFSQSLQRTLGHTSKKMQSSPRGGKKLKSTMPPQLKEEECYILKLRMRYMLESRRRWLGKWKVWIWERRLRQKYSASFATITSMKQTIAQKFLLWKRWSRKTT